MGVRLQLNTLAQAGVQLQMPQTIALALESAQDFMRRAALVDLHQCACSKHGRCCGLLRRNV